MVAKYGLGGPEITQGAQRTIFRVNAAYVVCFIRSQFINVRKGRKGKPEVLTGL